MTPAEILAQHDHRPWPLPAGPWLMRQTWSRLLFAHWALEPEKLRPLVPPVLELDTREGHGWVAVTPFYLSGLSLGGLPPILGVSAFPELNVRTYVRYDGKPGVFFFSLDAGSVAAVFGARGMYGLPYFYARMRMKVNPATDITHYTCSRNYKGRQAAFEGEYRPSGPQFRAVPGSLEQFLVERYCLYAVEGQRLYRAEIHHVPWPLHPASAEILLNTMAAAARISLPPEAPVLHYAANLDVLVWGPERLI